MLKPKEMVRRLIFRVKKKPYKSKVYNSSEIHSLERRRDREQFYGYYDRCPERKGKVIFHEMGEGCVDIYVRDLSDGYEYRIATTKAFNWQMGSRSLWIGDDTVSYNDFDGEKYVCHWYSLPEGKIIKTIPMAVMDYCGNDIALAPNFRRLRNVNVDYSYDCLPALEMDELHDIDNDGVWMYDIKSGDKKLLYSLQQIIEVRGDDIPLSAQHCVNHLVGAPDGKSFMFIHRYLHDGHRYDRLMYSDFKTLKCLLDDPLQSHFCWLDNATIMGYGTYNKQPGFYTIKPNTQEVRRLDKLTEIHHKDGHPTPHGDWVVVDSYPDFSRMQHLIAHNLKTQEVVNLAEVFHDMRHQYYTRCDLHPRFNKQGNRLYFDSIFEGRRNLYWIDVYLK